MSPVTQRPCRCDGRYTGYEHTPDTCPAPANTPQSRYWCVACDERRCDHITRNLKDALAELTRAAVTP